MKKEIYFNWSGKRFAIIESRKKSLGKLSPCYEESVDWENTENIYIEGDNLEVLKILQNDYENAISAIYIEPPYNIGGNYVYIDDCQDNLSNFFINKFAPNYVKRNKNNNHADWLNMMYERLLLTKKILRYDGIILISIGDYEVCHLKIICNEIFGEENFLSQSIHIASDNTKEKAEKYIHEYVLLYAKKATKIKQKIELETLLMDERFTARWANSEIEELFEMELLFFPKSMCFVKYLINAVTDKKSIILDFFSGSSTTAHAVMQLHAEDGDKRKFIMIELSKLTYVGETQNTIGEDGTERETPVINTETGYPHIKEGCSAREAGYYTIAEFGRERIRKARRKIIMEQKEKRRNYIPDIGFKVFKLDVK